MNALLFILPLCLGFLAHAATVTYDFNITWLNANPDGLYNRPVIGINGQWPIPYITATVGDRVIVNLLNQLGNESTSLHFHGLHHNGTNEMDGVAGVTQCAVAPGGSFVYNFTINQPGTYWYHAHVSAQYPDGLRGPLIVHDPASPYKGQYDEERVLTVSDWYHDEMPKLMTSFISVTNPTGAEPVPKSALFNDTQNLTTAVEPGKTYMFRIINIGAFAGQYVWFEGHTMQIVEVDGIYTKQAAADMIYVTAAQRYSVLITTKNTTSTNFAYVASMDEDLFDTIPDSLNPNVTGWLVYDYAASLPQPALLDSFNPFDDFTLVPTDDEPLLPEPDYSFPLTVAMVNLGDGANYATFNDIAYTSPKVPTLYSALSTGAAANNATIYGRDTHAYVLEHGDVIEIILNNNDTGKHPFHLHGHNFQVVARSDDDAGNYIGNETFPAVPMRRDTILLRPMGNIVLRFRADNPDKSISPFHSKPTNKLPKLTYLPCSPRIWLFHCHIEWHLASGLIATIVEAPLALQDSLTIPADHFSACAAKPSPTQGNAAGPIVKSSPTPTTGNAAGNTVDFFDLRGQNKSPDRLPNGFTARGIVALFFSVVSAFLGIAVISWYGAGEIGTQVPKGKVANGGSGSVAGVPIELEERREGEDLLQ